MSRTPEERVCEALARLRLNSDAEPADLARWLLEASRPLDVRVILRDVDARLYDRNDKPFGTAQDAADAVLAALYVLDAFSEEDLSR